MANKSFVAVVGAAQLIQRTVDVAHALDPLAMLCQVAGNGWYLTKHAATLFGSEPNQQPSAATHLYEPKAVGGPALPVIEQASARGRVDAYTITYDRAGAPQRGIVVGRTDSGQRFVANTPNDRSLLESIAAQELCGVEGRVEVAAGIGQFEPI